MSYYNKAELPYVILFQNAKLQWITTCEVFTTYSVLVSQ